MGGAVALMRLQETGYTAIFWQGVTLDPEVEQGQELAPTGQVLRHRDLVGKSSTDELLNSREIE